MRLSPIPPDRTSDATSAIVDRILTVEAQRASYEEECFELVHVDQFHMSERVFDIRFARLTSRIASCITTTERLVRLYELTKES